MASQVALSADEAYAVEVSAEIVPRNAGVQVLLGDGITIPVEPGTIRSRLQPSSYGASTSR